jgi:predicted RNA-binding protein with PIN domain
MLTVAYDLYSARKQANEERLVIKKREKNRNKFKAMHNKFKLVKALNKNVNKEAAEDMVLLAEVRKRYGAGSRQYKQMIEILHIDSNETEDKKLEELAEDLKIPPPNAPKSLRDTIWSKMGIIRLGAGIAGAENLINDDSSSKVEIPKKIEKSYIKTPVSKADDKISRTEKAIKYFRGKGLTTAEIGKALRTEKFTDEEIVLVIREIQKFSSPKISTTNTRPTISGYSYNATGQKEK